MLKSYDFDIVRSHPSVPGGAATAEPHPRALFRDPETRAAARALPEAVRNWLIGAGFSFEAHNSDLPDGYYAPQDDLDRLKVMQCLTATMKNYDLPKGTMEVWSNFTISEFVDAMSNARPLPNAAKSPEPQPPPPIPSPFARLRGRDAKAALAKATRRRWSPKETGTPFAIIALARRQGLLKLTLGTAFLYCAVLLYLYR